MNLYLYEVADPNLRALPKYAIGDRIRVTKITLTINDEPDTQLAFLAALGEILTIEEIILWKTDNPEQPYDVSYEVDISHLTGKSDLDETESIFLTADEIEPIIGSGEQNGEN